MIQRVRTTRLATPRAYPRTTRVQNLTTNTQHSHASTTRTTPQRHVTHDGLTTRPRDQSTPLSGPTDASSRVSSGTALASDAVTRVIAPSKTRHSARDTQSLTVRPSADAAATTPDKTSGATDALNLTRRCSTRRGMLPSSRGYVPTSSANFSGRRSDGGNLNRHATVPTGG